MNSKATCVTIVMMCIICPMLIGYAMPADYEQKIALETERTTNISSSLENDSIPAYTTTTGVQNNMYLYNPEGNSPLDYGPTVVSETVGSTTTAGTWALSHESETSGTMTVEVGKPISGIVSAVGDPYYVIYSTIDSGDYFLVNGERYTQYISFADSGQEYVLSADRESIKNVTGSTIIAATDRSVTEYQINQYVRIYDEDGSGNRLYADPSTGVQIPDGTTMWFNGTDNAGAQFVFKIGHTPGSGINNSILQLNSGNLGSLMVNVQWNPSRGVSVSDETFKGYLGDYDYVLVDISVSDKTVTVTGLVGMKNHTDDVEDKEANSITVDWEPTGSFEGITFTVSGEGYSYYCRSTSSLAGETTVMDDQTLTPSSYYPDDHWSFQVTSVGIYGDSLTFTPASGSPVTVNVEDGYIQPNEALGIVDPIRMLGLTVTYAPDEDGVMHTTLNGVQLDYEIKSVTFNGVWKTSIMLSQVKESNYNEYSWSPGNFGLDIQGFSTAGLMTAVGMFIAASLWGRRSGEKSMLALITSAICGGVYLMLMF